MPWVGGSIYHGYGVPNTIGMEFDKPWVRGSKYHRVRYTMGRGLDIPWVGVSTYHG